MRRVPAPLFLFCLLMGVVCHTARAADFHIAGPTIELRRLQYCTECDHALVVTTIAPGAAVRCPHCTSVQRRLPNRLLEERVFQVCPSCASRLDVAHLDPHQQLRCGTCGLAQYVLPEAVHRPSSQSGTGRIPPAHVVPDIDGQPPTWKEHHQSRQTAPSPGMKQHAPAPTPSTPSTPRPSPDAAPNAAPDTAQPERGGTSSLPPFDPRDPATLELYLQHEDALRGRRETASRHEPTTRPAHTPAAEEPVHQRAPATRHAPAQQRRQDTTPPRTEERSPVTRQTPPPSRMPDQAPQQARPEPEEEAPSVQPLSPALPPMPEGNPAHLTAQARVQGQHPAATPDKQDAWPSHEAQPTRARPTVRTPPRDPSLLHAATVNGEAIPVADVERLLREAMEAMQIELGAEAHTQAGQALLIQKRAELQTRILNTLIDRELIRQDALREGYRPDEQAVHDHAEALAANRGHVRSAALLEEARFQLILEDMHRRHARISEPVRPADVRAHYDAHLDDFREPAQVQLRNLVIYRNREGRTDTRSAAVIAQEVARRLHSGADYGALVHRYSECPFRDDGGQLAGGHGATVPLANLTRPVRMEVDRKGEGEVVGPVETVSAVVFSRVESLRPAAPLPFGKVAEGIRRQLILQRREAAFEAWVGMLREKADIDIRK